MGNSVKGVMIMDNNGVRILAKYYDEEVFPNMAAQKKFEKTLFTKTHKANAEIIMLDGLTCLYKSSVDLFFYVMFWPRERVVDGSPGLFVQHRVRDPEEERGQEVLVRQHG